MTRLRILAEFLVALLAAFVCATNSAGAEKSVEGVLEEINRLPSAERQRRLVEGAKKEGEVVWYSTMNRENSFEVSQAFEKEHPYVRVKILSGGAVKTMSRIDSEYRAKSYLFDVTHIRGLFLPALIKSGIIIRYRTPLRETLRKDFLDNDGYFNGIFTHGNPFILNKNLVKAADHPKSIEDLLHPKWQGRLAMDIESYDWLACLVDFYGEEKAKGIAERLGRQKIYFGRGITLLGQLVAAGEFPFLIDGFNQTAYQLREKQAPVDYIFPDPYVPTKSPTGIWIGSSAPHPHASALFVDFLLSQRAQEIMAAQGRWVSRKGIRYQLDPGPRKVMIVSPMKWGERYTELVRLFDRLLLLKQE